MHAEFKSDQYWGVNVVLWSSLCCGHVKKHVYFKIQVSNTWFCDAVMCCVVFTGSVFLYAESKYLNYWQTICCSTLFHFFLFFFFKSNAEFLLFWDFFVLDFWTRHLISPVIFEPEKRNLPNILKTFHYHHMFSSVLLIRRLSFCLFCFFNFFYPTLSISSGLQEKAGGSKRASHGDMQHQALLYYTVQQAP